MAEKKTASEYCEPGTELAVMLEDMGIMNQSCPACGSMKNQMNREGPDWCQDNADKLVAAIMPRAVKWWKKTRLHSKLLVLTRMEGSPLRKTIMIAQVGWDWQSALQKQIMLMLVEAVRRSRGKPKPQQVILEDGTKRKTVKIGDPPPARLMMAHGGSSHSTKKTIILPPGSVAHMINDCGCCTCGPCLPHEPCDGSIPNCDGDPIPNLGYLCLTVTNIDGCECLEGQYEMTHGLIGTEHCFSDNTTAPCGLDAISFCADCDDGTSCENNPGDNWLEVVCDDPTEGITTSCIELCGNHDFSTLTYDMAGRGTVCCGCIDVTITCGKCT